jgi:hypothetical protein
MIVSVLIWDGLSASGFIHLWESLARAAEEAAGNSGC